MNTKKTIRKILFVGMWLAIGSGMLTLLIAAMGKQKKDTCKGYDIAVKNGSPGNFFLAKEDISAILKASAKGNIKGQSKSAFNLQQMEASLEENVWIKDAQLYFDNHGMLHVSVTEREPVVRIFTSGGRSFYMDAAMHTMPLSEKSIAAVPVFTGFPDKKKWAATDSLLAGDIARTAQFISNNTFWKSQVAQINVTADCGAGCWQFEMTPVIGDHLVKLGTGEDIEKKFKRLFTFYQQVSAQNGFDKYKTIDVRFSGQVVAERSGNSRADSVQNVRRVTSLIQGTMAKAENPAGNIAYKKVTDESVTQAPVSETKKDVQQGSVADNKKQQGSKTEDRIPKAVMPKMDN